jgi:hypothetical protein
MHAKIARQLIMVGVLYFETNNNMVSAKAAGALCKMIPYNK